MFSQLMTPPNTLIAGTYLLNCRGRWGATGDTRVMYHDAIMVRSEVYHFNLGQYRRSKR